MPPIRRRGGGQSATATLAPVALVASRWIERLLASHDPALTPAELARILALTSNRSEPWRGIVAAGGVIDSDSALRLAALSGMVRRGETIERATERLELESSERTRLTELLGRLRGPPSPTLASGQHSS